MIKRTTIVFIFTIFLIISAKAAPDAPEFSHKGGFYENEIKVELKGTGDIYYTLDGSVPTIESTLYTQPIIIEPSANNPPKGVNIRAAVIGDETSYVSSNTYFVGKGLTDYVGNYPFVNLVADPYDYWDEKEGIYTNYKYEHKVPAVFHYITKEGQIEVNRTVEIKVSGNGSRSYAKKSLRVYFKKTDPTQGKYLEYDLIPPADVDYYSKVTFRISDWSNTNIKDPVAQQIAKTLDIDYVESVPMVLFLNGEYWGLYECREQHDEDYLSAHYDIDKDNIVYFDRGSTEPVIKTIYNGITYKDKIVYESGPEDGNEDGLKGETYYREQWDRVKYLVQNSDIASDEIYNEFCSMVDVDNFIDYTIVYLFAGNDDWPGNNFRFWRVTEESVDPTKKGADGKWRFMVHDFDLAFDKLNHDTLKMCSTQNSASSATRHAEFATVFYENLLKNERFRSELIQRISVYFSTKLSVDSIDNLVDNMVNERISGKNADLKRWGLCSLSQWKTNTLIFETFAQRRPDFIYEQFKTLLNDKYFAGIIGNAEATINAITPFDINGATIEKNTNVTLFTGVPATIKAKGRIITVVQKDEILSGLDELTFVPTDTCTINVDVAAINCAKVENGVISADIFVAEDVVQKSKIFVVGYNNKSIDIIKEMAFDKQTVDVKKCEMYKIYVWSNFKPLCKCYDFK